MDKRRYGTSSVETTARKNSKRGPMIVYYSWFAVPESVVVQPLLGSVAVAVPHGWRVEFELIVDAILRNPEALFKVRCIAK